MQLSNSIDLDLVLAIYNGEKFLPQLLDSLNAQSRSGWRMIYRDDDSDDKSIQVLQNYHSSNFNIIRDTSVQGNLGVVGNFSCLLQQSNASYVMLADQDDVWYSEKIAKSFAAIRQLERNVAGVIQPTLVFTDVNVVDVDINIQHSSFLKMQGLERLMKPKFNQLLTQNVAPGCTMIVNRALLDLALPIPMEAAMHDWWLMQVASLFGRIGYIDEPTMAYRQHGANQVGATSRSLKSMMQDILNGGANYKKRLLQAQLQAGTLIDRYSEKMDRSDLAAASVFASLPTKPLLLRQIIAWQNGLRKTGFIRNAGFYFLM
jgi:glycosyltransferase involved in cell wall biosynthesis